MRKLLLAFAIAIGVAGCSTTDLAKFQTAVNFATVGVSNPVTRERLYVAENGAIVLFAALKAYRTSCVRGAIPQTCKENIRRIQVYTRRIPGLLASVRRFVRENDTVNATTAFAALVELLNSAKAEAITAGVQVNG